ncbi:MAG: SRPBCC family protein [Proteobacteria bacterium]|nr:SRPBCC family protein [Pseudomonadota bacterium]NOG59480.1 SRPBCC family protein [Pseudomonadota bacterium]
MFGKKIKNIIISTFVITFYSMTLSANAMGGLKVSKQTEVNASPATVWKMIGDFNHLDVWHPVVVGSDLSGTDNKSGALRKLTLGNGANIIEKLVAYSDSDMTYTYAITESPLPVSDYVSTISVSQSNDGKTVVNWSSSFNAKGAEDSKAIETISGIYDAGLGSLSKHFSN